MARTSIALTLMIIAGLAFQLAKMFLYPMPYWYLLPIFALIAIYMMVTGEVK